MNDNLPPLWHGMTVALIFLVTFSLIVLVLIFWT